MPKPKERYLALEGSYNIRDIGGYATSDGLYTRWHTILRADRLSALTPRSQQALLDYGVRTVIDMRFPNEVSKAPDVFTEAAEITYLNLPLFTDEEPIKADKSNVLLEQNRFSLDECQSQMAAIFEAIITNPTCILVHCAIGKDRTGLIIALLLSLAQVPATTIAEDYALSAAYLSPVFDKMRRKVQQNGLDLALYEHKLTSQPETMLATLEYLREHYGGVIGYLRKIGLSDAQLERLRTRLVE